MKNRFGILSLAILTLGSVSLVGCSSEPADEPASPPPTGDAGTGKFKAGVDNSAAGGASTASPFRQSK